MLLAERRTPMPKSQIEKKRMAIAYKNAENNLRKYRAGKLGRLARLRRTAKELIGGKNTYLPKAKKKPRKPNGLEAINWELRLRRAGFPDDKIRKWTGQENRESEQASK